jgi:hypothetical protein
MAESQNRNIAERGNDSDKLGYQRYEHPELDVVSFIHLAQDTPIPSNTRYPCSVRIYTPEIRVMSRIGVIFQPRNPSEKPLYNLATLKNQIVAYRCMNAKSRIARVGEIVGKNGVPLEFPKSDIDGIAFQTDDDMPYIDVLLNLGFPGVAGTWAVYYHATSNNKLKIEEWQQYVSRVTMSVLDNGGNFAFGEGSV